MAKNWRTSVVGGPTLLATHGSSQCSTLVGAAPGRTVRAATARRAVALAYEEGSMATPIVSGSASGELAASMVKIARRYGVPVSRDEQLTEKLANLPARQEIPSNTYEEVARLFCQLSKSSATR